MNSPGDERIRATRRPTTVQQPSRDKKTKNHRSNNPHDFVLPGGDYYDVVLVDSTDFGVATPLFTRYIGGSGVVIVVGCCLVVRNFYFLLLFVVCYLFFILLVHRLTSSNHTLLSKT